MSTIRQPDDSKMCFCGECPGVRERMRTSPGLRRFAEKVGRVPCQVAQWVNFDYEVTEQDVARTRELAERYGW